MMYPAPPLRKQRIRLVPALLLASLLIIGGRMIHRAIVNAPYNALMQAIDEDNLEKVRVELDKGTDPNYPPETFYDDAVLPLCSAAMDGNIRIAALLLDRGADINKADAWGNPLTAAVEYDQIPMMEFLIARGAQVNDNEDGGSYSLWRAAVDGKTKAVAVLLVHGANPNATVRDTSTNKTRTLLSVVKSNGHHGVAAQLIQAGAKE